MAVPIEVPPLRTERTPVVNAALRWWWADPVAGLAILWRVRDRPAAE